VCPDSKTQSKRRTAGELLEAARRRSNEKALQRAERQAAEQARQARKAAKARARYLDQLAEREQATSENVTTLVDTKQPGKYDLAVGLLVDLRDLAARRNEGMAFQSAGNKLREVHAAKPSFLRRLGEAGL
jgi:hypothetical protein